MLKQNETLTPELLATFPNCEIFASGVAPDSPNGLNMWNSGKWLTWVACKGGVEDWAVYVRYAKNDQWTKEQGDKVHNLNNIRNIMNVSDSAFALYRM